MSSFSPNTDESWTVTPLKAEDVGTFGRVYAFMVESSTRGQTYVTFVCDRNLTNHLWVDDAVKLIRKHYDQKS